MYTLTPYRYDVIMTTMATHAKQHILHRATQTYES